MRNDPDLLKPYRDKRDFTRTAEPPGKVATRPGPALRFVVQKHAATRLHFDFRLELDGVLKSWAVTKGPSLDPTERRLAVRVEDHPLEYGRFEGTIPEGEYGGGTVMLWDEGTWEPIGDPHEGLEAGDLKFRLHGTRMKGEWVLVHMKGRDQKTRSGTRENWLLIKHRDGTESDDGDALVERFTTSVTTGRSFEDIAAGKKSRRKSKASAATPATAVWSGGKAQALPAFRPPQLATLVDTVPAGNEWLFEMKYDGYRALAAIAGDQVRVFTRAGNDWTETFADLVPALKTLTKGTLLLDGEICALKNGRSDFSTLKDHLSQKGPLAFFLFDILEKDGENLEARPNIERKAILKEVLKNADREGPLFCSEHVAGHGEEVLSHMCATGEEGVIAKLAAAPYRHDRGRSWLKIKCTKRQEFVVAGWRPSEKKSTFASLILGTWEDGKLVYRGRVGTGYSHEVAEEIQRELAARSTDKTALAEVPRDIARHAHWVKPELVAEIAFTELTPDGHLRHPSFIGLRGDKKAKDVRLETAAPETGDAPAPSAEAGIAIAKKLKVALTHPERVIYPGQGVTKAELFAYYEAVADRMLPHLKSRPLSLVRCPQGRAKACFFQKHDSGGFPEQLHKVPITEKDGETKDHMYISDLSGILAAVQMSTLEFHIWGSRIDRLETPDRLIFDIDPDEGLGFPHVIAAAFDIRDRLKALGLDTFPLLTGGKGVHVVAPLTPKAEWPEVKAFAKAFAQLLEADDPARYVANMSKAKRKGRMFVDYLRNERGSTAIAPFSTRSRPGAPAAVPLAWDELGGLTGANVFSIADAARRAREPDPWAGYFKVKQALSPALLKKLAG